MEYENSLYIDKSMFKKYKCILCYIIGSPNPDAQIPSIMYSLSAISSLAK